MNRLDYEIKPEDFTPIRITEEIESVEYSHSIKKEILSELKHNRIGRACVIFLILIVIASLCAPLTGYDPNAIDATAKLKGISWHHWLGTDDYGRDYFTRVLYGSQVSLLIGVFAMLISVCVGTIIGTVSGYVGGKTDMVIMRLTDVFLSLPAYLVALVLKMFMDPTLFSLVLILSLFAWPTVARITRAETMTLKNRDFVVAARSLGAGNWSIILHHIIPNMLNSIIVAATLSVAGAILAESFLSFLGLGVQLPRASWGSMLQAAQSYMTRKPVLAIVPGLLILLTVLSFNVLGDILQKVLEPKRSK